jgi:hypothetical protein
MAPEVHYVSSGMQADSYKIKNVQYRRDLKIKVQENTELFKEPDLC